MRQPGFGVMYISILTLIYIPLFSIHACFQDRLYVLAATCAARKRILLQSGHTGFEDVLSDS